MRSVLFGASGLRTSEFCLGAATFGAQRWGSDRAESARIFQAYAEAGGRFIDVANTYADGRAEEIVGDLVHSSRDEFVIGTKYTSITRPGDLNAWGNHRKSLRQSLSTSLKRMKTDYVDVFWVHSWDGVTPLDEIMRALDDEISAGRVLYVGVSNTPAWTITRANTVAEFRGWTPFVGLQTGYSLVMRTPELELFPMARYLGLQVMAWSPLAGGLLAGGYTGGDGSTGTRWNDGEIPVRHMETAAVVSTIAAEAGIPLAAVALAWLRQRPGPIIPILGARTVTQLQHNLEYLDMTLSADCLEALEKSTAPTPIMPGEDLDTPRVQQYFHGGARDALIER